jgi:putative ABC transport system permease protein
MGSPLRNVRYAFRVLSRTPAFTLAVVLTLAVGIGANTTVFSALDAVLIRPLPFPDGDRLVRLTEFREESGEGGIGMLRMEDWNRLNSSFEAITNVTALDASDTTGELPERSRVAAVAPRFLDVLSISPMLGRGFNDVEHQFGGPCARLISERYWKERLGADPDVLTRTIRIDNEACPIVGVMPASFRFPDDEVDIWTPEAVDAPWDRRIALYSYRTGIARLRTGVTLQEAQADLARVQAQLGDQYPETDAEVAVRVTPYKEAIVGRVDGTLWLLFGAVSVLLLIACSNIAALALARAARREQEIAVCYVIGASRAAVIAQVLTEAAVLACAGAALGLLVALGAPKLFVAFTPQLPRVLEIGIDARILLYVMALTVIVTLLCGLIPAVTGARARTSLTKAGRGQVAGRQSAQWALVGVQIALSVILLAGAGLLLRSFDALSRVNPGFDADRVLMFRMNQTYDEGGETWAPRIFQWVDELEMLAGVEAVAASSGALPGIPPLNESLDQFQLEGQAGTEPDIVAERRFVTPDYFATMAIPLVAGEVCRGSTIAGLGGTGSAREVMVNRSFAVRHFADRSPVGLHVTEGITPLLGGGVSMSRIAGVVGDARENGLDREPAPTVYSCFPGEPNPWFLLRTTGDPGAAIGDVRAKMQGLAPLRSVYPIGPLAERIEGAYAEDRLQTVVLTLFAGTALALASLGVYGTLGYVAGQRRREVGLRIALGARSGNIMSHFLFRALRVIAAACIAGVALALLLTRALSGLLYGVTSSDPITLTSAVVVVAAVAVLAALLPAMRASRTDPMQSLREE